MTRWFDLPVLRVFVAGAVLMASAVASRGADPVILTVSPLDAEPVQFSRADLEQLEQVTFRTGTPWTEGVSEYRGPSLLSVLEASGIEGGKFRLEALNDYMAEISFDALTETYPVMVTRIDGAAPTIRNKGPIWLLYPFDDHPELLHEEIFLTTVWNLAAIVQLSDE